MDISNNAVDISNDAVDISNNAVDISNDAVDISNDAVDMFNLVGKSDRYLPQKSQSRLQVIVEKISIRVR